MAFTVPTGLASWLGAVGWSCGGAFGATARALDELISAAAAISAKAIVRVCSQASLSPQFAGAAQSAGELTKNSAA
jgi:plasmid maintenance system antidote protein VapI